MRRAIILLAGVLLGAATWAASGAGAHGVPGRISEPVVVPGSDLAAFAGAPREQLWAWSYDHEEWEILRVQLDERDRDGDVVADEDGVLDDNDEVVFMADLVGERRGADDWPPGIERDHAAAEVRITDPLDPEYEGFVYLFWSASGPEIALAPLVRWDPDDREIRSDAYVLGLADRDRDGFTGLRSLRLFAGSANLLDRLKLRAVLLALGVRTTWDEEDSQLDLGPIAPVASGRVRLVLNAAGNAAAYERRVALPNPLEDVGDTLLPGVLDFVSGRASLDFLPSAGTGAYDDANLEEPVPIDGMTDPVPSAPWSPWRSWTFLDGTVVSLGGEASGAENYYADGDDVPRDTGDDVSFGDAGVASGSLDALRDAAFPGELVMVSPGQDLTGDALWSQRESPLAWSVSFEVVPTPTGPTDAPSPTPTPSATPTSLSTAVPGGDHTVYLPATMDQL